MIHECTVSIMGFSIPGFQLYTNSYKYICEKVFAISTFQDICIHCIQKNVTH